MSGVVITRAKGLHTSGNPLSDTPAGTLSEANNVIIRQDGLVEPRPGFIRHGAALDTDAGISSSARAVSLHNYFAQALAVVKDSSDYKLLRLWDEDEPFVGTNYVGPDWILDDSSESVDDVSLPVRSIQNLNTLYLTTSNGLILVDDYDGATSAVPAFNALGNPRLAAPPEALGLRVEIGDSGSAVNAYSQVAYRYCIGYTDSQGREILGEPSARAVAINTTSSAKKVDVRISLPGIPKNDGTSMPQRAGITEKHKVYLYRTRNSYGQDIDPGDEYFLVDVFSLDDADKSAAAVINGDTAPHDLYGVTEGSSGYVYAGEYGTICVEAVGTIPDTLLDASVDSLAGSDWNDCSKVDAGWSSNNIAVGDNGQMVGGDWDSPWTKFTTGTTEHLYACCEGDATSEFLACGANNTFLKGDGAGGVTSEDLSGVLSGSPDLYAVFFFSGAPDTYIVGGESGALATKWGGSWIDQTAGFQAAAGSVDINGLWLSSANTAYIAADSGKLYRLSGIGTTNTFTSILGTLPSGTNYTALDGYIVGSDLWVCATNGNIYYTTNYAANPPTWSEEYTGSDELYSLYHESTGTDTLRACGADGTIIQGSGANSAAVNASLAKVTAVTTNSVSHSNLWHEDNADDVTMGPPLYTNANVDGILQQNSAPGVVGDCENWNDRAWYTYTDAKESIKIQIKGTSASDTSGSIDDSDYLFIYSDSAGTTKIANYGFDANSINFRGNARAKVETAGTVSANLKETSQNLADAINTACKTITDFDNVVASSISKSGSDTATVTYEQNHGLRVGDSVTITPGEANFPAGTYTVLTVPSDTTLTYADGTSATASDSVDQTVTGHQSGILTADLGEFRAFTTISDDGFTDLHIERKTPTGAKFYLGSNDPTAWTPQLNTSGVLVESSSTTYLNRLWYSKLNQPQAVPIVNYLDIGSRNKRILKIQGMGNYLYVFKEDGIHVVPNVEPYGSRPLDRSVILTCLNSVAELGNSLYAMTNQGVVRINEGGVSVISNPIEEQIAPYNEAARRADSPNYDPYFRGFGVADQNKHLYILALPDPTAVITSPAKCTKQFAYNELSRSWTTWDKSVYCGAYIPGVDPMVDSDSTKRNNDTLLFGETESKYVTSRNPPTKSATNDAVVMDDYIDVTINSQTEGTNTVVLTGDERSNVKVGDLLTHTYDPLMTANQYKCALITAVDADLTGGNTVLTVQAGSGWSWADTGAGRCYISFVSTIRWNDVHLSPEHHARHWTSVNFVFKRRGFYSGYSSTVGEFDQTAQESELIWNDRSVAASRSTQGVRASNKRVLVPKTMQRSSYIAPGFRITEAGGYWALAGLGVEASGGSERGNR